MTPCDIFLRGIWKIIPDETNLKAIDHLAKLPRTDRPCGDYGEIIRKMLEAGIPAADIARLRTIVGYETAFGMLYHMSDPVASYEGFPPGEPDLCWKLEALDGKTEKPVEGLGGAYESLLSRDPSGREMRPPGTSKPSKER